MNLFGSSLLYWNGKSIVFSHSKPEQNESSMPSDIQCGERRIPVLVIAFLLGSNI